MNELTFELVKLVLTLVITFFFGLITKELIPWFHEKVGNEKTSRIENEVRKYVLAVQQQFWDKPGEDRRSIVTEKVKQYLGVMRIDLTDEQIRDLIEAAVRAMKIQSE